MASSPTTSRIRRQVSPETRFNRTLAKILIHATDVFYEKGYEGASIRDLSRASGMSLAGLYYYFDTKERLLYLIQKHTFSTIVARLRQKLEGVSDPEHRIRLLIHNHLDYFLANPKSMKVLSHEDDALKNGFGAEIASIKREYYRIGLRVLEEYRRHAGLDFNSRIALLSLFGMMNWIYTWHNSRTDADATHLASQMADIFLRGVAANKAGSKKKAASNGKGMH